LRQNHTWCWLLSVEAVEHILNNEELFCKLSARLQTLQLLQQEGQLPLQLTSVADLQELEGLPTSR
jgi:hypothetical protein